jgi:hypothetical protein
MTAEQMRVAVAESLGIPVDYLNICMCGESRDSQTKERL